MNKNYVSVGDIVLIKTGTNCYEALVHLKYPNYVEIKLLKKFTGNKVIHERYHHQTQTVDYRLVTRIIVQSIETTVTQLKEL